MLTVLSCASEFKLGDQSSHLDCRHLQEVYMLIHIRQRQQVDCVIACAAMLVNVTYDECLARSPAKPGARGMTTSATLHLLKALTDIDWQHPRFGWYRSVCRLKDRESGQLIFVSAGLSLRRFHCIALHGDWVHDPSFVRGFPIVDYPRRDWKTFVRFRPVEQDALTRVRQLNWPTLYRSLELDKNTVS